MRYTKLITRIDSFFESTYDNVIINILLLYIWILKVTCRISFENNPRDCVILFWHENIYNLLLLRQFAREKDGIVVANSDKLDYWIKLITKIRLNIFVSESPFWIRRVIKYKDERLMLALDGPYGPSKVPNTKIIGALSRFKINYLFINCNISNKVQIGTGWNQITLPLPFSKILFELKDLKL